MEFIPTTLGAYTHRGDVNNLLRRTISQLIIDVGRGSRGPSTGSYPSHFVITPTLQDFQFHRCIEQRPVSITLSANQSFFYLFDNTNKLRRAEAKYLHKNLRCRRGHVAFFSNVSGNR